MLEAARAVRAHHDHVGAERGGSRENLLRRMSNVHDHIDFPLRFDGRAGKRSGGFLQPLDLRQALLLSAGMLTPNDSDTVGRAGV